MAITLTEAAASRVKAFLEQRGKGVGLRLGVKTTGCSGMAYVIEYADPDRVLERVLYQGTIPKGRKQLIESSRGKIVFSYRRSSEDRAYGDNHADCVKGNVISIP